MINIMLVDDEELVTTYIEQMIDWEEKGYHIAGSAASGRQALELYEKYRPEIVISDIRMPGMDGLELTRILKEKNKELVVILMSAYKDFEYAKKGIQYGVSNYLLKHELSEETILSELELAKERLEREKEQKKIYQKHLMGQLIHGQKTTENIERIPWGNRLFLLMLHKSSWITNGRIIEEEWNLQEKQEVEKSFQEEMPGRCVYRSDVQITKSSWMILYEFEEISSKYAVGCLIQQKSEELIRRLCRLENSHVQIIYSCEIAPEEISGTFRKMAWQIRYEAFRKMDRAYSLLELSGGKTDERRKVDDRIRQLRNILYEESGEEAGRLIRQWFQEIQQERQLELFREILPFLEQLLHEIAGEEGSEEETRLWTVTETGEYYARRFEDARRRLDEHRKKHYSRLISDVIQYLQRHYGEDVSLDTLGDVFQMNGSYLGRVFRKETGSSVLKYVTNLRIEKAKYLLRRKNCTVSETAWRVGYQTSQYFSQIFMKTVGVSPQEYRRWEEKQEKDQS